MASLTTRRPAWTRRPSVLGWCSVAAVGAAYPWLADPTQQPLAIFLIPIFVTAAMGSWIDTLSVGLAALAVALVVGIVHDDWNWVGLTARMSIMAVCWIVGVVVAFQKGRSRQLADDSDSRKLLLDIFQDSLAPTPIPPPGVVVSTRYIPGDERMLLGGDFFDAIRLPTGSLGYIIGDVCGQGPRAAGFGAAVRSGWKTLATAAPTEPLRWVHGLDEAFFRLGRYSDTFVTLNTGIVEPDRGGAWTFVSAGHPWPLVLRGSVDLIKPNVGPPLGAGVRSGWSETTAAVARDGVVMLYTDGLIENARAGERKRNDGEGRLIEYLERAPFDLDGLLEHFGPDGFDDDVAIMTIALA